MKNIKSYLPALALALGVTAIPLMRPAQAQQRERQKSHEVVVLQAQYFYYYTPGDKPTFQWAGFSVYNASSSAGAPQYQFPASQSYQGVLTNNLGQTLADLMNLGFRIVNVTSDNTYTLEN